jgi:hypothetical protein
MWPTHRHTPATAGAAIKVDVRQHALSVSRCGADPFNGATAQLIALHAFKQRLEVAFAKALVGLALNELEEHRPQQGLAEDLQEQALFTVSSGFVQQNASVLNAIQQHQLTHFPKLPIDRIH